MLTHIEINGFKSFENFAIALNPFTVILGNNASGKSNLFDAIQLLSHLANTDLHSAFKGLRGEPEYLFRERSPKQPVDHMQFAVEVLLEPVVCDPWGKQVTLNHTRMRYELEITRIPGDKELPRLVVTKEQAIPILAKDDVWPLFGKESTKSFRQHFLKYTRRVPWLETEIENGKRRFRIRQDNTAARARSGEAAEATVLSSITTTEFPHLYALREELRSWHLLQLDPMALRKPSSMLAEDSLLPDGSNLAAVLYRLWMKTRDETYPNGILADIAATLSEIIPGVLDVAITRDDAAREYRTTVKLSDGSVFPTSVISDGTLRVLGLLTLLHDPDHRGVVCFEEPENGIHPARLHTLVSRLRTLVTDPGAEAENVEGSFLQLLMNSHSPVVLSAVKQIGHSAQIYFADLVTVVDPKIKTTRRKTRMRPVLSDNQTPIKSKNGESVSLFEVRQILESVNREA